MAVAHRVCAFTLVELMIVVIILGILAAVVIPQFSDASGDARLNAMAQNLTIIRKQIEIYRLQHNGTLPGVDDFALKMTQATDADGTTSPGGTFGPYLRTIPINPFTDDNSIGDGAVGSSSWYFDDATGEFRANCHDVHTGY